MVEALAQPLLRITSAALLVKAANFTSPSTPSAMCRASVDLPVPAKPNRRNTGGVPSRLGFQPVGNGLQRGILMRAECGHGSCGNAANGRLRGPKNLRTDPNRS